jgi:phosphoserine phosphatase
MEFAKIWNPGNQEGNRFGISQASNKEFVSLGSLRQHWRMTDVAAKDLAIPLCVDLDGTLINTDMLWESLKDVAHKRPWCVLLFPVWFLQGRAHLKKQVAARANVDAERLPFHHGFLEFLKVEKARGRRLILATASDQVIAERIATRFGLFDEVLGSDGQRNLRGPAKARLLVERFGLKRFDYAGNSHVDLQVWPSTRHAIIVNGSEELVEKARSVSSVSDVFPEEAGNPCRAPW